MSELAGRIADVQTEEKTDMTHAALVDVARKWLLKTHAIVITEISCGNEEPDAIGWRGGISTLVEVKVSRADFLGDRRKMFRAKPEMGIGAYRYFMVPKGMVENSEISSPWGLLEWDGKRVWKTREPEYVNDINHLHEKVLLISTLRRVGQSKPKGVSINAYYYETRNRTTLSLDLGPEGQC